MPTAAPADPGRGGHGRQALALLASSTPPAPTPTSSPTPPPRRFAQHPDHEIITSFPGLADLTGARVLAEIGDDRARFADARALKAYAGSAPVTRASGRSISVTHRRVKNNRLAAVGYVWAFAALTASPGPPARTTTAAEPTATATPPPCATCSTGCSASCYHCLHTRQTYDPIKAFGPHRRPPIKRNLTP